MRRFGFITTATATATAMALLLAAAACGDGSKGGSSSSLDLDLAGAAARAQQAIDQGDELGDCPWKQQAIVDAISDVVPLVPEFASLGIDNGQVFSGGEVDITYCEIYTAGSTTATDGIEELRIDVHPGTADLQQYLDENWGGDGTDASSATDVLGGALRSWCLDDDSCLAVWQGDGLFVGLVVQGVTTATAVAAAAALEAALPVVVAELTA